MSDSFVPFDDIQRNAMRAVVEWLGSESNALPEAIGCLYLVRNVFGRVRISVSDKVESEPSSVAALDRLAAGLHDGLGVRGYSSPETTVLFVSDAMMQSLAETTVNLTDIAKQHESEFQGLEGLESGLARIHWAERLVTGGGWWTVSPSREPGIHPCRSARYTLASVRGGVGRTTTAAVLARHLARAGRRVLILDLDLESPGISSAVLEAGRRPKFGITDWFAEDLVKQGDPVVEDLIGTPEWSENLDGHVRVAPAHGREPGEYLAKLGRVYLDLRESWTERLHRLLGRLESEHRPEFVLIESRSGLHDIWAATVTDLDAEVLLFATDSESHWTDYGIIFRHWQRLGLAKRIRERLSIVSSLTPELDAEVYLKGFRARAWKLFRGHLYDDLPENGPSSTVDAPFSFDAGDDGAPYRPGIVYWNRGLAAGSSLHELEESSVNLAYGHFLPWFDEWVEATGRGDAA